MRYLHIASAIAITAGSVGAHAQLRAPATVNAGAAFTISTPGS